MPTNGYNAVMEQERSYREHKDAFAAYEALPAAYHKDPRWKEVKRLRASANADDRLRANGLVMAIRADHGFEH